MCLNLHPNLKSKSGPLNLSINPILTVEHFNNRRDTASQFRSFKTYGWPCPLNVISEGFKLDIGFSEPDISEDLPREPSGCINLYRLVLNPAFFGFKGCKRRNYHQIDRK